MRQLRLDCPLSAWTGEPGRCQWCDKTMPEGRRTVYCSDRCRRAFEREHFWPRARATARRRGLRSCINGCEGRIEVNHIVPLVGAGYGPSCLHHQTNLELLCCVCHREVTAQQRVQRRESAEPGRQVDASRSRASGGIDARSGSEEAHPHELAALGLGAPAQRALMNAGLHTLVDVTRVSERFLLAQHGFGPSSLPKLRAALAGAGLTFAPSRRSGVGPTT